MKAKHWIALFSMSFAGELAWGIQTQIFNLFLFNEIVPRPLPVSLMVASGAVVATLTAIFMGAWSDQIGRRKPFILAGYTLWGVTVMLFPATRFITVVGLAVAVILLLNALVSFFRATAYEASYNAYLTDITTLENRGTAQGVASLGLWVAMVVTFGGLGLIDATGWQIFFFIVGALVIIMGDLGGVIVEDSGVPTDADIGVFKRVRHTFRPNFLRRQKNFFLILLAMGLFMMSFNIFFPFILIYLQHFLELPVANVELLVLVSITVGGIVFAIPAGILSDKIGRKKVAIAAILIESIFVILFAFSPQIADALPVFSDQAVTNLTIWSGAFAIFWLGAQTAWMVASYAWSKDWYPEEKRAEFSGYTTIFQIGVGGGLGALLGGIIANASGTPGIVDGQQAIIPSPTVFIASGIIVLITLIPVYLAQEKTA
ncbi:MAG: MFS transporter [Anaerolineae bacterium]|nr:MFS transporter [Anaerolineae bacterium]MCO5198310.1 MFS transporter [Anaerolineae bacterium]